MKTPISKKLARGLKRAWPEKKAPRNRAQELQRKSRERLDARVEALRLEGKKSPEIVRALSRWWTLEEIQRACSRVFARIRKKTPRRLGPKGATVLQGRKRSGDLLEKLAGGASTRVDTPAIRTRQVRAPEPPQWLVLTIPDPLPDVSPRLLVAPFLRFTLPGWRWWVDDSEDAQDAARASVRHAALKEGVNVEFVRDWKRLYVSFGASAQHSVNVAALVVVRFARV